MNVKKMQKANQELIMSSKHSHFRLSSCVIPSIDRSLFSNPVEFGEQPNDTDLFIGRGSFGVVKCQMYRGIYVAVKEFLPHTLQESVMKEARMLFNLCHPYLPLLLGVCVSKLPYILVVQYYGIGIKSVTFRRELREKKIVLTYPTWIILCAQIVEALRYLHTEVGLLHNDLKGDNVLITDCKHTGEKWTNNSFCLCKLQIVLVDFGKATKSADGRKYSLSFSEKRQYHLYHQHIAPELIEGVVRQSFFTDIYSLGILLLGVTKTKECCGTADVVLSTELTAVVKTCMAASPEKRPSVLNLKKKFEQLLKLCH